MLTDERIRDLIVDYLNETRPSTVPAAELFKLCKRVAAEAVK